MEGEKIEKKKTKWFMANNKYATISIYAFFVIFFGALLFLIMMNWKDTKLFFYNFLGILSPFFIGILIAYFVFPISRRINSVVEHFAKKEKSKKVLWFLSIIISYLVFIGFIVVAFVFVIPQVVESIAELTRKVPVLYDRAMCFLEDFHKQYPEIDTDILTEKLDDAVPQMITYGKDIVGNVVPMVFSLSVSIVRLVINILLGLIISVYLIVEKDMFKHQFKRLVYAMFSTKNGNEVCKTLRECNNIFSAFLISKAVDSLIIGCICCVAMNILNLPYAVLLSLIVGITNMIPYFGPFIGAIPGVCIYLCLDVKLAVIFAIMIFVLQQFDGLVLGPKLLGQSTGLSPIWVIFGITVGGAYFGVVGMFIGVPVIAVFAFLINKFIAYRLKKRGMEDAIY